MERFFDSTKHSIVSSKHHSPSSRRSLKPLLRYVILLPLCIPVSSLVRTTRLLLWYALMTSLLPDHDQISIVLLIIFVLSSRLRRKVASSTFSESKSNTLRKAWNSHNTNTLRTCSYVLECNPVDQSRPPVTQKPPWLRPLTPTQSLRRTYTNA